MKRFHVVTGGALTFGLTFAASAAFGVAQDGYANIAGVRQVDVNIDARSFNVAAGQCNLYSTLLYDGHVSGGRQVEVGVVRCAGGQSLDAATHACTSGHFFAEVKGASGYYCNQGATFSTWTDYPHEIWRPANTDVVTGITADGTYNQQGSFAQGDALENWTWAEETPSTTACPPSGNAANFNTWTYQAANGTTHPVTSAQVAPGNHAGHIACWNVGALATSGAFNVAQ